MNSEVGIKERIDESRAIYLRRSGTPSPDDNFQSMAKSIEKSFEEDIQAHQQTQACFGMACIYHLVTSQKSLTLCLQIADIPVSNCHHDIFSMGSLVPVLLAGDQVKRCNNLVIGQISEDISQVLQCLNEDERFEIQAFCQLTQEPGHSSRRPKQEGQGSKSLGVILHVNVYGSSELSGTLGSFLEDVDIYLQTPENCDRDIEYQNPHLLTYGSNTSVTTLSLSAMIMQDGHKINEDDKSIDVFDLMAFLQSNPQIAEAPDPISLRSKLHRYVLKSQSITDCSMLTITVIKDKL
jgi:hypothetical protein